MDDLYNEDELKDEGMKVVSDDAVADDDALVADEVVEDIDDTEADSIYGANGRPREDEEDPDGHSDGLSDMEAYMEEYKADEWTS